MKVTRYDQSPQQEHVVQHIRNINRHTRYKSADRSPTHMLYNKFRLIDCADIIMFSLALNVSIERAVSLISDGWPSHTTGVVLLVQHDEKLGY